MARRLYIVSVYRPELLDGLLLHLGMSADAKVILDRRRGDRRALPRRTGEARQNDRRRSSIDRALREHGFAVVELDDREPAARALTAARHGARSARLPSRAGRPRVRSAVTP